MCSPCAPRTCCTECGLWSRQLCCGGSKSSADSSDEGFMQEVTFTTKGQLSVARDKHLCASMAHPYTAAAAGSRGDPTHKVALAPTGQPSESQKHNTCCPCCCTWICFRCAPRTCCASCGHWTWQVCCRGSNCGTQGGGGGLTYEASITTTAHLSEATSTTAAQLPGAMDQRSCKPVAHPFAAASQGGGR